jgi:hypothetical protein
LLYRRIKYWFVDEKYLIQLVYVFIDMILNFIFHESFEFMCSRFYNLTLILFFIIFLSFENKKKLGYKLKILKKSRIN